MSELKIIAPAVPNVPWQDKPENHKGAPVWRYSENPIIDRNPLENVARIFNSAVMPYEGKSEFSQESRLMEFLISILEEAMMAFTGILIRIRYRLRMRTAMTSCLYMHMTRDL